MRLLQLKVKHWCIWQELNLRQRSYQERALPLSYRCIKR